MVAWFIIAIATMAVFGFIAVNGLTVVSSTTDQAARIENVRRLDSAVQALLARAVSPTGNSLKYLPAGEALPSGQGYGLPRSFGVVVTPFGKPIIYCPFGDKGVTGTVVAVSSVNGTSYDVATVEHNGRRYVVGGRPAFPELDKQPNLMAFVLAPRTKLSADPSCSDVIYNPLSKQFEAPDTLVRTVMRPGGVPEDRVEKTRGIVFYVAPGAVGKGVSASDPASLAYAINFYRSRLPAEMTINLQAGSYSIGPADLNVPLEASATQSNLAIKGAGVGVTSVVMASRGNIQIPGNLVLADVAFSREVAVFGLPDTEVSMFNAQVGALRASGVVTMQGTNTLTYAVASDPPVRIMNGGHVQLTGTLNVYAPNGYGIFMASSGKFNATAAQINFNTTNGSKLNWGFFVRVGAEATFNESVVHVQSPVDYPIYVDGGELQFVNSTLHLAGASLIGIIAVDGSRLAVATSEVGRGSPPPIGIEARGSLQVDGRNSNVYARSACWTGTQFAESQVGNGQSSSVPANVALPAMSASPTGAQVQAFVSAQATNLRRQALRQTNQTAWTCYM